MQRMKYIPDMRANVGADRRLGLDLVLVAVAFSAIATMFGSVDAQPQVTVYGRVQWIAGQTLSVIPNSGAPPVNVDLTRIPLREYSPLRAGDWVVVEGTVAHHNGGHRVIATSVRPGTGWDIEAP
jgi:hypothetical protein